MKKLSIAILLMILTMVACSKKSDNQTIDNDTVNVNFDEPILILTITDIFQTYVRAKNLIEYCGYTKTVDDIFYCDSIGDTTLCIERGFFITTDISNVENYPGIVSFSNENYVLDLIYVGEDWEGIVTVRGYGKSCNNGQYQGGIFSVFFGNGVYYIRGYLSTDFATTFSAPVEFKITGF